MASGSLKTSALCVRVSAQHIGFIDEVAEDYHVSHSEALAIMLDALLSGVPRTIVVAGVRTPCALQNLDSEATRLFSDLDSVMPRLNAPMPRSGDPTLIQFVREQRGKAAELLPRVDAFVERLAKVQAELQGAYKFYSGDVIDAADRWVREFTGSRNPGAQAGWVLLSRAGLLDTSPPCSDVLRINTEASHSLSKLHRCDAPSDKFGHQITARITPKHKAMIREWRRECRLRNNSAAVRDMICAYGHLPPAARVFTHVASANDFLRAVRLSEPLIHRCDAIASRLSGPFAFGTDYELRLQVSNWIDAIARWRPDVIETLRCARLCRNLIRSIPECNVVALQSHVTHWMFQTESSSDTETKARGTIRTLRLLFDAIGLTPSSSGARTKAPV